MTRNIYDEETTSSHLGLQVQLHALDARRLTVKLNRCSFASGDDDTAVSTGAFVMDATVQDNRMRDTLALTCRALCPGSLKSDNVVAAAAGSGDDGRVEGGGDKEEGNVALEQHVDGGSATEEEEDDDDYEEDDDDDKDEYNVERTMEQPAAVPPTAKPAGATVINANIPASETPAADETNVNNNNNTVIVDNAAIKALEKEIAALRQDMTEKQNMLERATQSLQAMTMRAKQAEESMKNQNKAHDKAAAKLKQQLHASETLVCTLHGQLSTKRREEKQKSSQCSGQQNDIKLLKEILETKEDALKKAKAELAEETKRAASAAATTVTERGALLADLDAERKRAAIAKSECDDMRRDWAQAKEDVQTKLAKMHTDAREKDAAYAAAMGVLQRETDSLSESVESSTAALADITSERDLLKTEVEEQRVALTEHAAIKAALEESKEACDAIRSRAEIAETELRNITKKMENLTAERNALKRKAASLSKDVGRIVNVAGTKSLCEAVQLLKAKTALQVELAECRTEKTVALDELADLKAALTRGGQLAAQIGRQNNNSVGGALSSLSSAPDVLPRASAAAAPKYNNDKNDSGGGRLSNWLLPSGRKNSKKNKASGGRGGGSNKEQLLQVLANELTQSLEEKEEMINQQRFALRELGARVQELERQVAAGAVAPGE